MKIIQTNLLIGGALDGQRKELPFDDGRKHIRLALPPRISAANAYEDDMSRPFEITTVEYRRERFRAEDTIFDVWVLAGMTTTQALESLFSGYRPEKSGVMP